MRTNAKIIIFFLFAFVIIVLIVLRISYVASLEQRELNKNNENIKIKEAIINTIETQSKILALHLQSFIRDREFIHSTLLFDEFGFHEWPFHVLKKYINDNKLDMVFLKTENQAVLSNLSFIPMLQQRDCQFPLLIYQKYKEQDLLFQCVEVKYQDKILGYLGFGYFIKSTFENMLSKLLLRPTQIEYNITKNQENNNNYYDELNHYLKNGKGLIVVKRSSVNFSKNLFNGINTKLYIFCFLIIMVSVYLFFWMFVTRRLKNIYKKISSKIEKDFKGKINIIQHDEINSIDAAISDLFLTLEKYKDDEKEQIRLQTIRSIALQVAHDIRSPLSALNMVARFSREMPEDKRRLVHSAVRSITDIANQLAGRNIDQDEISGKSKDLSAHLVSSVVDSLVSEKRMQYRNRRSVSIEYEVRDNSYGVFSLVNLTEFRRVLSNLINNSVESFVSSGEIHICVDSNDREVMVIVEDNGKGIPEEIKDKLFKERISSGKASGSGLGLTHAYHTIYGFGGRLEFESKQGMGTMISIAIPKTEPPSWFVSALNFDGCKYLIILDDDESIHQIWRERIGDHLKRVHFNSIPDFQKWLTDNHDKLSCSMFLIDYELLGTEKKGIDIIMENNLRERAILVTSYFEEPEVVAICQKNHICIMPKFLAGFTKLAGLIKNNDNKVYDYILIDDKSVVRDTWQMGAKMADKRVATYSCVDEFMRDADIINKEVLVYIDSDLGGGERGEVLSEKIYNKGFKKIYLTTGFGKNDFTNIPWITDIVDKEPPFHRK